MVQFPAMTHLHLDPLGGIAGDMFAAALLDAFPEHAASVTAAAGCIAGVACRVAPHRDNALTGSRFVVADPADRHHGHRHDHAAWRDIRARLLAADLPEAARQHAIGIFAVLAEAEGQVHGIGAEEVTFHEVGAADSIADITAAAMLIAALGEARWTVGPLPLGSGRVRTAHGQLPVPAPATALLLRDFPVLDDGIAGERVTPTGAAILRYLGADAEPAGGVRRLRRTGTGFGTRRLAGVANCLRVLVFEEAGDGAGEHRMMSMIGFEVDDQTPEDLAAGLDRLRITPGVLDVVQMPAFGKKGRMAAHVQVLAKHDAADAVAQACFRETSTIGLRIQRVEGRMLPRRMSEVAVAGTMLRVKLVERPDGTTAKAECGDALGAEGRLGRMGLRREAEQAAIADQTRP